MILYPKDKYYFVIYLLAGLIIILCIAQFAYIKKNEPEYSNNNNNISLAIFILSFVILTIYILYFISGTKNYTTIQYPLSIIMFIIFICSAIGINETHLTLFILLLISTLCYILYFIYLLYKFNSSSFKTQQPTKQQPTRSGVILEQPQNSWDPMGNL